MSRELTSTMLALLDDANVQKVAMVHMAIDDPVYVHSGLGKITYGGNTYVGIGVLGSVSDHEESEALSAQPITFTLSGLDHLQVRTALNAAAFGDQITLYEAFIDDAGTIIGEPLVIWSGSVDSTSISVGPESSVSIVGQHDIADIDKMSGARWTDEDQQGRFSGDLCFQFIHNMPTLILMWAGGATETGVRRAPGPELDYEDQQDHRGQG